jgi:PAS domain S-box-containing protein
MLQPDEGNYRFLLESSADILWTIDTDFRWQFITGNIERMVHVKASDLIGKPIWDLLAPKYHALVGDLLKRQLNGETIPAFEAELIDADGKPIPFEVKTSAIVNKEGKAIGVQGIPHIPDK